MGALGSGRTTRATFARAGGLYYARRRGEKGGGMHFPMREVEYGLFQQGERTAIKRDGPAASRAAVARVGARRTKLSHDEQLERARPSTTASAKWQDAGTHGTCELLKACPHLHANNAFPLPVAHAFLQGVVKQLMHATVLTT